MNMIDQNVDLATVQINVERESVETLLRGRATSVDRTFFTQSTYLRRLASPDFILVELQFPAQTVTRLLFSDFGKYLRCCNRTERIPSDLLNLVCKALFEFSAARFIIFEDIDADRQIELAYQFNSFTYQENWVCDIVPGSTYLSSRQASNMRRKTRRLTEQFGDIELVAGFRRCLAEDIDTVIAFNAKTLESKGRKYRFDDNKKEIFKSVAAECGYLSGLYAGDRLIAGDIVCVTGEQVYFNVVGYDLEFEKFSPGMQVHVNTLGECAALGCKQANFLWGNSRWKSDIGGVRMPLTTLFVRRGPNALFDSSFFSSVAPYVRQKTQNMARNAFDRIADTKYLRLKK